MGDEADPNLYFSTPGPWNVNATRPVHSSLGQIVYAGTKWGSQATYAHAPPPKFMRPTPHFLLVLTLEGKASYMDETGLRCTLQTGSLIWAAPGVNQSYGPKRGERWSELFLWFRGPLFDAWQGGGFPGARSRHLELNPLNYWTDRLRRIIEPSPEAPVESDLARICQFQQWLADALQFEDKRTETTETLQWRERAEQKLRTGRLTDPSLEEIARSMGMSYSAFRKRFVQMTGKSPGEYRADEIVLRACSLLLETSHKLAAIAADLGFHDAFHLSKRFKQVVGMSPQDFRRQNRGR
jgi:AraC-like DNA-binding protein